MMATRQGIPAAEVDGLYGLPLEEFTRARDELARRLRSGGERGAAQQVKRLRKPGVAAWALNQVRRDDPRGVEALVEAGGRLREATERLLAGEREPFEHASAEQRRLVEMLAHQAELKLTTTGHSVTPGLQNKLLATLRAVATDAEAGELLSSGRLVRDYQVSDLGFAPDTTAGDTTARETTARDTTARDTTARDTTARDTTARDTAARTASRMQSLRQRLQAAQARRLEIESQAEAAQRRVDGARQAAAQAAAALAREESSAAQTRARAREAAEQVAQLQTSLRELESAPG